MFINSSLLLPVCAMVAYNTENLSVVGNRKIKGKFVVFVVRW